MQHNLQKGMAVVNCSTYFVPDAWNGVAYYSTTWALPVLTFTLTPKLWLEMANRKATTHKTCIFAPVAKVAQFITNQKQVVLIT